MYVKHSALQLLILIIATIKRKFLEILNIRQGKKKIQ
jgi:hypothetical protein